MHQFDLAWPPPLGLRCRVDRWPRPARWALTTSLGRNHRLTPIAPVIDAVLCPIASVVALVLSIVRATVRPVADAIAALLTKVLLVLDPIRGVVHRVMPALDPGIEAGRKRCLGGAEYGEGCADGDRLFVQHLDDPVRHKKWFYMNSDELMQTFPSADTCGIRSMALHDAARPANRSGWQLWELAIACPLRPLRHSTTVKSPGLQVLSKHGSNGP